MVNYKSSEPCVVCGESRDGMVTMHHVRTRRAYPELSESKHNLMSLCLKHHNEVHSIGSISFANKYPSVMDWFAENDWVIEMNKLIHSN